ncbi:MAG TPA: hypothetical protein EYG52_18455 [Pseudomonadales bacterium]|nr:hypothetical protein [Gammaproteobacteria bacterium]HIL85479.1 hypothetical protein [Pseudomonadales bacterium]
MADINIENFYKHIARILSILYEAFPSKSPLYVDDVAGVDDPDEYGLHSPDYTAGFFAMLWLADEQYIRYMDTIRQDGVDQAVLTHKAFLKLTQVSDPIYQATVYQTDDSHVVVTTQTEQAGSPPSVVEDHMLVINQLRHALRSGDSIAIAKVVRHILHS